MSIDCIMEFDLNNKLGQVRSVPVRMGRDEKPYILFVYSEQPNLDPWEELFSFPRDTLKMALYGLDGQQIWIRDLGSGVVPGVWFTPFLTFDLDDDGVDEIYFVNNLNENLPLSLNFRVLERIDPRTGKTTGQWKWPENTWEENISHCYRFFITGGYAQGQPVLICAQGTYGDMFLQAYSSGMKKRWEIVIGKDDPGARSSHVCPVWDINGDGVDELFWGERLISVDDGKEVFCADKEGYKGHSDIVIPFIDTKTNKKYIYTCREGDEGPGISRVVTYDEKGAIVWRALEEGHMHRGWIANVGTNYEKIAMAVRINRVIIENKICDAEPQIYYFDAISGQPVDFDFPYRGSDFFPIDIDGDGYHEFIGIGGDMSGVIVNRAGKVLGRVGGEQVKSGKMFGLAGEQVMQFYSSEGKVRIWGDRNAHDSDILKARHNVSYHDFMQQLTGTGYNHINGVISCAI